MKHHGCRLAVACWAVLLPIVATADPITLLSVRRSAGADIAGPDAGHLGDSQFDRDVLAAGVSFPTDAGTFTAGATLNSQVSAVNGLFSGTGSAFMSANPTNGREQAGAVFDYELEFSLSSPQQYSFQIRSSGNEPGPSVIAFFLPLQAFTPNFLFRDDFRNSGSMSLETTGVLSAGRYRFVVLGGVASSRPDAADFQGASLLDYSFQLRLPSQASATPEPTTLSLLTTGVFMTGAGMLRRRRAGRGTT